jgi:hypothetical protein
MSLFDFAVLQDLQFWHGMIPWMFCLGLGGCFCLWAAAYLLPLRHTAWAVERVASLPFWAEETIGIDHRRVRASEHIQACADAHLEQSFNLFKSQWSRHMALAHGVQVSTVDVADVVTVDSLMPERFATWFSPSIPGFFTGTGLLGTVVGLVLGLKGVGFGGGGTAAELMGPGGDFLGTVQPLLSGMYTAFVASIAGISLSLVWNALDGSARGRLTHAVERLHHAVRAVYPSRSEANLLLALVETAEEMKARLGGQGLQEAGLRAIESLASQFVRSLNEASAAQFAALATAVEDGARSQAQLSSNLERLQQRVEGASHTVGELQEVARRSGQALAATGAEMSAAERSGRDASRQLEAGLRELTRQLGDAQSQVQSSVLAAFERELGQVAARLHEMLEQTRSAMEQLEGVLRKAARAGAELPAPRSGGQPGGRGGAA